LSNANPSGQPKIIVDDFTVNTLNSLWTVDKGTVSVTDGGDPDTLKVSTLDGTTSTCVVVMANATFQNGAFSLKVKFPSESSTARAGFVFAHDDNDTYYAIVLRKNSGTDTIELVKYTSGSDYTVWVDGVQKLNSTITSMMSYGTVALAGQSPKFSNVKAGYDNNADNDIDDAGDDLVISDTFGSTTTTLNTNHTDGSDDGWDPAGNLIIDEFFIYTYDAWQRMVKVTSKQDTDVTIQTAAHDGLGRRIKKVVSNSGDLDGTWVYYYNGHKMIEAVDGSGDLLVQVYHGTQYIDEVVSMKTDHGYMIVNQDANWIRTSIAVVFALAALTTGLAWAANWPFPLAVLQTVGLADEGSLRGVTWEVYWTPEEEALDYVWIGVRERSARLSWHRSHREARGRSFRYFYGGPWPAGIQTVNLARPYKRRLADGSSVDYWSLSLIFLELPLLGLCLIFGAYPTVVLFRGPIRRRRRRRRGLCLKCGYDVRLLTEPRCPECWTPTEYASMHANEI